MIELPTIPPLVDRSDDVVAACAALRGVHPIRLRSVPAVPSPAHPIGRGARSSWVAAAGFALALVIVLALAGALLAGIAYSEPVRRLAAHMTRDADSVAAAHPDDPAAARLLTATAALGGLVGSTEEPVAVEEFDADVDAVKEESTARGRVVAAVQSAGTTAGTIVAGILGTLVTVLVGPTVVRRVGSAVSAGARWATDLAKRAGVPEALVKKVTDQAAEKLSQASGPEFEKFRAAHGVLTRSAVQKMI